jgi:uracil-DNA glycosylase family 4
MNLPKTFVRPTLNTDARFAFFGEQPGVQEVKYKKVFCGPAGDELDRQLDMADIPRTFCYLSNILKDFDEEPYNYIQLYQGDKLLRNPIVKPKGKYYLELLKKEVAELSAPIIGAFGGISLFALTGRTGITNWRGSILNCEIDGVSFNKKVIPMFHPATVIKPKNQFLNRRLNLHDMERLRNLEEGLYVPTNRGVFIKPTYQQVMEFLNFCYEAGLKGERISYDIEVFMDRKYKQVSCISFAVGYEGMSIPFVDSVGDYFTIKDETTIWKVIASILENPFIRKCGQNLTFDAHFLLRTYGIAMTNADDTMIAQRTIMPDYPIGLDFITSWWTDQPYYKRDGKEFLTYGGAYETFWHYNCLDSIMCSEVFPKQWEEIVKQENEAAYERQRKMIEPCCFMMEKGLLVNVEEMEKAARDIEDEIEKILRDLKDIVGHELNPNSGKQLYQYFHDEKGFKPYVTYRKKKKAYTPTFDDIAMKRMARKGFRDEAGLILKYRRLVKQKSNYLDITKIDKDNRARCQYKPSGTRYSRLSSAENIFGTGGNQQNWPAELQSFLIPDPNYAYFAFDLDQAENRIVAYVGEILNMIEVFESGEDVHSKTGMFIVNTFFPDGLPENFNIRGLAPMGDGTHSWRDWGKKANHGFNYDWGSDAFALKNEISNSEGLKIYNAYHGLYPGVKRGYHAFVRRCLRTNRTLVNLLGRKTIFLDALNDSTFKEAYSCIPQGTVGDIINERGIEYIYYNQDLFKPVDILRQVHDEIDFQIPLALGWKNMVKIINRIKKSLEVPLRTHYGREFVVPASITMNITMNKRTGFDIDSADWPTVERFPEVLSAGWEHLHSKFESSDEKKKVHKQIIEYGKAA